MVHKSGSDGPAEISALAAAAQAAPGDPSRWRALADACFRAGQLAEADAAYQRHILASVNDPALRQAALDLAANRLAEAERVLKPYLKLHPTDVAAIRMLAELAARIGRFEDAETLLDRTLELSPGFGAARLNLAVLLLRRNRAEEALEQAEQLLEEEPGNPAYLNIEGVIRAKIGDYGDAAERFAAVLAARPQQPRVWLSQGHALKTLGRQDEAVAAYRQALAQMPGLGEAWWSLANLKAIRFSGEEIAAMERALDLPGASTDDIFHLHFALGKALEDAGSHAASFAHYREGNALRAAQLNYDPAPIEELVRCGEEQLTREFFESREGWGDPSPDPVFVLGMPRSGSTLVEQILSSHPAVEGTRELPDAEILARSLGELGEAHLAALARATPEQLAQMGAQYLARTRVHRKTGRPLFIDKMPNNWAYVPLIRLMLPGARIIDTRRGAMACCFSNFRQHYARGQAFSYRLAHLARYYSAYVRQMEHLDAALPGVVHRVDHERLVDDSETEIRRLLNYLDLPFDPACLRFWETERAVQTASSEQVRRPIFRDGIDQWRPFAPFLDELREGLGALAGE